MFLTHQQIITLGRHRALGVHCASEGGRGLNPNLRQVNMAPWHKWQPSPRTVTQVDVSAPPAVESSPSFLLERGCALQVLFPFEWFSGGSWRLFRSGAGSASLRGAGLGFSHSMMSPKRRQRAFQTQPGLESSQGRRNAQPWEQSSRWPCAQTARCVGAVLEKQSDKLASLGPLGLPGAPLV